jgi:Uma2 family endonuclease
MAQEPLKKIHSLPTEHTVIYPESDGKPMAETDIRRKLMTDLIEILGAHFEAVPNVYVSGNLLLYYQEGQPKKSVAPDVFVVFGVEKTARRTYRLWEEGKAPDFVLELASESTYRNDLGEKKDLYAQVLGVKEYYLYDPDRQYLPSPLLGFRLAGSIYTPIQPVDGRLPSQTLGLELGEVAEKLRLYSPHTKDWMLKPVEEAEAKAQQAEARAQQAETRAQREAQARQQAEDELDQLRAELEEFRAANE